MDSQKFNEYEQREAKNFILLEKREDFTTKQKRSQLSSQRNQNIQKQVSDKKAVPRIRSASTGRDKRSEFLARYWAFLFGNLQRAIDEIYKTIEYYENVESCQEAILVLENYIREFKALANFFKMSWDYEKTPKRPLSVAWEIRKTNAVPRVRNRNSPAMSGKSSPSYSGTSSPCCNYPTIEENKKVTSRPKSLMKENLVLEMTSDSLSAKEKKFEELVVYLKESCDDEQAVLQKPKSLSLENLNQDHDFRLLVIKDDAAVQTEGMIDDNLTLQEYIEKYCTPKIVSPIEESTSKSESIEDNTKIQESKEQSEENLEAVDENIKSVIVEEHIEKKIEPEKHTNKSLSPTLPLSKVTPLSQILKPVEKEKPIVASKPQSKTITRANYSLRNQTINPRVPEKMARKPSISTQIVNRTSRAANINNIPSRNSVLNTSKININDNVQKSFIGRSKTMIEIPKKKPVNLKTGELRKKNSTEDNTDSSSSTLKASIEKLGSKNNLKSSKNKIVKKPDSKGNSNGDGEWFIVKNKRRSSWANSRFDQPSASASLPTLTLLNENSEDSDKEPTVKDKVVKAEIETKPASKTKFHDQKKDVKAKSKVTTVTKQPIPSKIKPVILSTQSNKKMVSNVKAKVNSNPPKKAVVTEKSKPPLTNKQNQQNQQILNNTIKRQKSDITGLKIKSLHKEYLRNERSGSGKKKKDNVNETKVDMNTQTVLISQTIDELYSELGSMKTKANFTNGILSSCEEIEERDLESDDDQKKLVEEQENLERQIRELENSIDTDIETDCEAILCDLDDNESSENNDLESIKDSTFGDENIPLEMRLEMRYAPMLAEMSDQEREETLATLQEFFKRDPGRAQKLHQKLSSPSRRRSVRETLKKYQVKHSRALEKRITIQTQKAHKIQQLIQRVEQVKAARDQLIENRRLKMEEKLQRATENRENFLKNKIRKAHDEEEKLKEIAFIKNLEMQNKMLDFIESCKEQEVRRQDLEQERQKRQTEKLAKEAAVERRRLEIELERKKKLERMDETRREREQRVEKIQEEKEKLRQEIAKEKQRDRDKRLQAIQQQQLQDTEELQRKITKKQEEYQKRHEENLEHIRHRAFELAQQRNPDDTKSQNDEEENLENIERTRESIKNAKKKMKKIKEKFIHLNETYLEELPELATNHRKQSQIPKLLNAIKKTLNNGSGNNQLGTERPCGQIIRIIEKSSIVDFHCLWLLDGLGTLASIIENGIQPNSDISRVAVIKAIQLYRNASSSCKQIAQHSILGGSFITLLDVLIYTLKNPEIEVKKTPMCPVEVSTEIFLALTVVLSNLKLSTSENAAIIFGQRIELILSYITASGILELITKKCLKVREPIENQQSLLLPLLAMMGLLTKIAEICPKNKVDFLSLVKSTEIFGTITLLYRTMSFGENIPKRTISLAGSCYGLIKAIALLDINCFQQILNEEKLTFKFLDVITILLNYCGPKLCENDDKEMKAVIRDLVVILGYFSANHKKNQNLLTSDQSCIILKSITKLPIDLAPVYYPTLLTIIWENAEAEEKLAKDFDIQMLKEYEKSTIAKKNQLLHMLEI
ncbi:S phase cyclin A-associated protein in the endoplasmic reticulum [Chironomus tepperi]|uniref:S phase cyclin A-associated protein in the endoplasmic reticulum n=1 Tax=Chironomus tepperi TaxID=113505 RepID=UPI00391FC439